MVKLEAVTMALGLRNGDLRWGK
ncbi:hypothetical protein L195_g023844, partial [Trifolium pratense]